MNVATKEPFEVIGSTNFKIASNVRSFDIIEKPDLYSFRISDGGAPVAEYLTFRHFRYDTDIAYSPPPRVTTKFVIAPTDDDALEALKINPWCEVWWLK